MARLAPSKSPRGVGGGGGGGGGGVGAQDENCPVCRSTRYMNANLRFLMNPECYHKMCESCVDRIFSHGPAQCPIRGCTKTLRKHRFRVQTFEDVQVEREVDIRRRVAAVFNRREDDFESVRDYNDYLNEVEDITFNLINNIDVEKTEKRFQAYKSAHEQEIQQNASLAEKERLNYAALQKQDLEQAKLRREAARREEAEERKEMEEHRRDMLNRLAAGQDVAQVARQAQQVSLSKRKGERTADSTAPTGKGGLVIKGLKARVDNGPEAPIDPFGGVSFQSKFFSLQDEYVWNGVQEAKTDRKIKAGGYNVAAFTGRALHEAFAGLEIFLADETTEREQSTQNGKAVSTARAEIGARDVKMEDPF